MAPSPEFAMDKVNQNQKTNNKADGTPKTESKKVRSYMNVWINCSSNNACGWGMALKTNKMIHF